MDQRTQSLTIHSVTIYEKEILNLPMCSVNEFPRLRIDLREQAANTASKMWRSNFAGIGWRHCINDATSKAPQSTSGQQDRKGFCASLHRNARESYDRPEDDGSKLADLVGEVQQHQSTHKIAGPVDRVEEPKGSPIKTIVGKELQTSIVRSSSAGPGKLGMVPVDNLSPKW